MRVCLCSSEPMSPTPVNNLGPEQIISILLPQPDTAPWVPIRTPDTVLLENPPVQNSTVAMSTLLQQSSWDVKVPQSTCDVNLTAMIHSRNQGTQTFQSWIEFGSYLYLYIFIYIYIWFVSELFVDNFIINQITAHLFVHS